MKGKLRPKFAPRRRSDRQTRRAPIVLNRMLRRASKLIRLTCSTRKAGCSIAIERDRPPLLLKSIGTNPDASIAPQSLFR